MFEKRLICLFGVALVVGACSNLGDPNARVATNRTNSNDAQERANDTPPSSNVRLRIVQRTSENLFIELRNDSDHPIFVSYAPSKERNATSFLAYSLQKRAPNGGDFSRYGDAFHNVPNLHPISSRSAVTFRLIHYPSERGEYNVRVGYYEDESVYRMISERLTEMTDAERKSADQARKYVVSNSFLVPSNDVTK